MNPTRSIIGHSRHPGRLEVRVALERVQRAVAPLARVLDPPERRGQRGRVERVDPHRPGAQPARHPMRGGDVRAPHRRRQPVARCGWRARRRAPRRRPAGSPPPDRTPPPARSDQPDRAASMHRRLHVRPAGHRLGPRPADEQSRPVPAARSTRPSTPVEMLSAHHRAQLRGRLVPDRLGRTPAANDHQQLRQRRHQRALHDHPGSGVTGLTGVVEDPPADGLNGRVQIAGIRQHDVRGLAAQLQRHRLAIRLAGVDAGTAARSPPTR